MTTEGVEPVREGPVHDVDELPLRTVVGAGVVALALLVAPLTLTVDRPPAAPVPAPTGLVAAAAEGYLDAWARGDLATMRMLVVDPPPDFEVVHQRIVEELAVVAVRILAGEPEVAGERAIVPFAASLDLAGLGTWDYQGRLDLALAVPTPTAIEAAPVAEPGADPAETADPERSAGAVPLEPVQAEEPRWAVAWSPASLHPASLPAWPWLRSASSRSERPCSTSTAPPSPVRRRPRCRPWRPSSSAAWAPSMRERPASPAPGHCPATTWGPAGCRQPSRPSWRAGRRGR
ncbi:MAG: hypothetical protein M3507_11620 [Actinomycetota bacterium]|nr:hypothetical protein [Actinomycetota bacterium]